MSERKNFKNICVSKGINKSRIVIFILTGVGALVGFFVGEAVDLVDSLKEIKQEEEYRQKEKHFGIFLF